VTALPQGLVGRPIAHRGLWRPGLRPENSLAAFEAACAAGYGIELDVQLTADGEAVVFHDHDLDRMTAESGLVEERTAAELSRLTLLGGDHQTIPLLADALAVIAGRVPVLVELKTPPCQDGPLEARAADLLRGYAGPAAVLSFNAKALAAFRRHAPEVAAGLNLAPADRLDAASFRPDFLSINQQLAGQSFVADWRTAGGSVIAWTVRTAAERQALEGHVDNIVVEGFRP